MESETYLEPRQTSAMVLCFFCQKFNSRPIAPTFHALLTTSVSLYTFICLSYSSGYCFTSLHKRSVFILISISSDRAMCHPLSQGYGDPAYYIFSSQIKWCYYVCISFFTLLLFAKILQQIANGCANLSIFSEVFLFHEITWTKNIKKFWYIVYVISWKKRC